MMAEGLELEDLVVPSNQRHCFDSVLLSSVVTGKEAPSEGNSSNSNHQRLLSLSLDLYVNLACQLGHYNRHFKLDGQKQGQVGYCRYSRQLIQKKELFLDH